MEAWIGATAVGFVTVLKPRSYNASDAGLLPEKAQPVSNMKLKNRIFMDERVAVDEIPFRRDQVRQMVHPVSGFVGCLQVFVVSG